MEPIRYNRELYIKTVQGIKKIQKIKQHRDSVHWKNRMLMTKELNRKAVMNELKKHVDLIDNKEIKTKLKNDIKQDQKLRQEKLQSKKSKLQMLISNEQEQMEVEED